MTLNPLGGHFAEGDGAAGFFFDGAFFVGVGFIVGVACGAGVVCGLAVGLGELITVGEGAGDSVTAKPCVGRRERTSVIAKKFRFIDRSI
jgi:hypothetical protein